MRVESNKHVPVIGRFHVSRTTKLLIAILAIVVLGKAAHIAWWHLTHCVVVRTDYNRPANGLKFVDDRLRDKAPAFDETLGHTVDADGVVHQPVMAELFIKGNHVELYGFPKLGRERLTGRLVFILSASVNVPQP
jgi:hypothetical protein